LRSETATREACDVFCHGFNELEQHQAHPDIATTTGQTPEPAKQQCPDASNGTRISFAILQKRSHSSVAPKKQCFVRGAVDCREKQRRRQRLAMAAQALLTIRRFNCFY